LRILKGVSLGELIVVTGGARSGKSDFAEQLAGSLGAGNVCFVATAEARDEEMSRRIAAHQASRPEGWETIEAPRDPAGAIAAAQSQGRVALVDCLTVLVSNLLEQAGTDDPAGLERAIHAQVQQLAAAADRWSAMIVVTNEVGLGLVPGSRAGRLYRDALGRANRELAASAERVYWLIAGLPVDVKQLATPWPAGDDWGASGKDQM
jgi:adenosylcobinamide kinase/adenosylcobinamide-phosphate guanylyltransferase